MLASFRCRDSLFQRFLQWRTKTSFKVRALVKTQAFFWTVLTCVFLNTIVLAVEYHNQPEWLKKFQCKSDVSIRCILRLVASQSVPSSFPLTLPCLPEYLLKVIKCSPNFTVPRDKTSPADMVALKCYMLSRLRLSLFSSLSFSFVDYAEIVFLTIFFVEMLLKLYGLGIHQYFSSSFNMFDFAVSICYVER